MTQNEHGAIEPGGTPIVVEIRSGESGYRVGGNHVQAEEALKLILASRGTPTGKSKAETGVTTIIRADRRSEFGAVSALLTLLAQAETPDVWFAVRSNSGREGGIHYPILSSVRFIAEPVKRLGLRIVVDSDGRVEIDEEMATVSIRHAVRWIRESSETRSADVESLVGELCVFGSTPVEPVFLLLESLRECGFDPIWFHPVEELPLDRIGAWVYTDGLGGTPTLPRKVGR